VHDFTLKDIDGKDVSLSVYKGKVLLIVNVASKCGFTPQYAGLQALHQKYADRGLVVLGFPSNDFLWQEPGTDAEIKSFCALKYNVTFPMFSKIQVRGKNKHPLYDFLTSKDANPDSPGEVGWNFAKFLISRDGRVAARFAPADAPDSPKVIDAVEKALK
jgi:glutathione peroxidase